jgi:predicted SAM-dependent methyltransferase
MIATVWSPRRRGSWIVAGRKIIQKTSKFDCRSPRSKRASGWAASNPAGYGQGQETPHAGSRPIEPGGILMAYELNLPTAAGLPRGTIESYVGATYAAARAFLGNSPLRLHLGCGTVRLPGWVNIDVDGGPDLQLDLRFGLPFPDASVDLIHTEHMLEHMHLSDGRLLMGEAHRVLRPGGTMRIGVPDLEPIVRRYAAPDWREQPWIQSGDFDWIDSPVALINTAFRGWEHLYLYDETELRLRLEQAGFTDVRRVANRESTNPDLAGLETRPETDLIVEVVK